MTKRTQNTQKAIDGAGGPAKIAKSLGISSQAVSRWHEIPSGRVIRLCELSGMRPWEIRPDLYPPKVFAA